MRATGHRRGAASLGSPGSLSRGPGRPRRPGAAAAGGCPARPGRAGARRGGGAEPGSAAALGGRSLPGDGPGGPGRCGYRCLRRGAPGAGAGAGSGGGRRAGRPLQSRSRGAACRAGAASLGPGVVRKGLPSVAVLFLCVVVGAGGVCVLMRGET